MSPPPTPDLRGVIAKLDRAEEHLGALDASIKDVLYGEGDPIVEEFDLEKQWYIARFRIGSEIPERRWGILLGDAVQNLRAALDHLVYQLAILSGNNPARSRTQWPIVSSYDDYWKGSGGGRPRRDIDLEGVNEEFRKLIDDFQPCSRGPREEFMENASVAFKFLGDLSNTDKHRIMNASVLRPRNGTTWPDPPGSPVEVRWPKAGPKLLQDGTELYRWRVNDPAYPRLPVEVQLESYITFEIAFGRRAVPHTVIGTLNAITRGTVQFFSAFFPAGSF